MALPTVIDPTLLLLPALADEILGEIFLRLPSPEALARTSTACSTFRRIVTERSFLRQFRKRHPPPLHGLVNDKGDFQPAEAPHPSAPLTVALVEAADFTYSFVPKPSNDTTCWYARDVRDGRVLLECSRLSGTQTIGATNYAACDPLSRRSVLLPPIPEDMAMIQQQERLIEFSPILAPVGEDEDGPLFFKVICLARHESNLVTFVFSSISGQWHVGPSPSWSSLGTLEPSQFPGLSFFNYQSGCFYWPSLCPSNLLVLDTRARDGVFYYLSFDMWVEEKPNAITCFSSIVAGTEGAFEIFTLVNDSTSLELYHAAQQNNGGSSIEWQLKKVTVLPPGYLFFVVGATEGILFLGERIWDGNPLVVFRDNPTRPDFFSLEVRTWELKKVCSGTPCTIPSRRVHSYFGFPPPLRKPSL